MGIGRAVRELAVSFASADVLVLCYHAVRSRATFAAHIGALMDRGYRVIGVPELVAWLRGAPPMASRAVVLTFDGGYLDQIDHAVPVLEARGLAATFFPISAYLEAEAPFMTKRELVTLAAAGHTIGCHTHTHRTMPGLSDRDLDDEVSGSRRRLEDAIGRPVTAFAYPDGATDARVAAVVRRAGFDVAFTIDLGGIERADDPYRLKRVPVLGEPGAREFSRYLGGTRVLSGAMLAGFKIRERLHDRRAMR